MSEIPQKIKEINQQLNNNREIFEPIEGIDVETLDEFIPREGENKDIK
ncbi:MAG: hypothetical protein WCG91_00230 [Candidatus Shapirobacteria bacterium]